MHEVSLCESIIRIVERQAQKDKFTRVVEVVLTVGDEAGVSLEALEFCFPLVAKETIADGAKLTFTPVSGTDLRVSKLEVG